MWADSLPKLIRDLVLGQREWDEFLDELTPAITQEGTLHDCLRSDSRRRGWLLWLAGIAVGRKLPGAARALDEAPPPLMTAELLGDLPSARKAAVTIAVGLRPVPGLPLQITAQLTSNVLSVNRVRKRSSSSPRACWDCLSRIEPPCCRGVVAGTGGAHGRGVGRSARPGRR